MREGEKRKREWHEEFTEHANKVAERLEAFRNLKVKHDLNSKTQDCSRSALKEIEHELPSTALGEPKGVRVGDTFIGKAELAVACVHSNYDSDVDAPPLRDHSPSLALALCLDRSHAQRQASALRASATPNLQFASALKLQLRSPHLWYTALSACPSDFTNAALNKSMQQGTPIRVACMSHLYDDDPVFTYRGLFSVQCTERAPLPSAESTADSSTSKKRKHASKSPLYTGRPGSSPSPYATDDSTTIDQQPAPSGDGIGYYGTTNGVSNNRSISPSGSPPPLVDIVNDISASASSQAHINGLTSHTERDKQVLWFKLVPYSSGEHAGYEIMHSDDDEDDEELERIAQAQRYGTSFMNAKISTEGCGTRFDSEEWHWGKCSPTKIARIRHVLLRSYRQRSEAPVVDDVAAGQELVPIPAFNELTPGSTDGLFPGDEAFIYIRSSLELVTDHAAQLLARVRAGGKVSAFSENVRDACNKDGCLRYQVPGGLVEDSLSWGEKVIKSGVRVPLEIFKTGSKGWAVRSKERILAGAFVCEYVGRLQEDNEANASNHGYTFDLDHFEENVSEDIQSEHHKQHGQRLHLCLDGRRAGNVGRWINSSRTQEDANLVIQPTFTPETGHGSTAFYRICFFACMDIAPFAELTYFYGDDYLKYLSVS